MAKIQKYNTPKGQKRWRVRWVDGFGHQKSKTFSTYRLANDYMIKLEHTMREGSYVEPSNLLLSTFLNTWIEGYSINIRPGTYRGYKRNIKLLTSVLDKPLQKVNPADIEKAYATLKKTLSGTSVLYIHRVLSRALKDAEKQRLINRNTCDLVNTPKKDKSTRAKIIHPDDLQKYLAAFEGHYLYIAVYLAMSCGLRRGEVCALKWSDIRKGVIHVDHNLTAEGLGPTKSGRSKSIPVTSVTEKELRAQKKRQSDFKVKLWGDYNRSDFVVTQDDGSPAKLSTISIVFQKMLKKNNLEHVRFHDLRHSAASLMIMAGIDLKTVSLILGHSTIAITADTYGHIIEEHKREAISKIDRYFKV